MIRPVPQTVSLDNTEYLNYNVDDGDDEMFLDEDEAIESNKRTLNNKTETLVSQLSVNTDSRPVDSQMKRKNSTNSRITHVIYKRNMFDHQKTHSDYCKHLFVKSV